MGNTSLKSQIQKLKGEKISLEQLQVFARQVRSEEDIQIAIREYLQRMTLRQKLGQLQQLSYYDNTLSPQIIKTLTEGGIGSSMNVASLQIINQMQKISMEQSRLKIPLLVGRDVIHGYRTIFPIPLAQAASFDPDLVEAVCRVAAIQCSAMGIKWTFGPMVDVARDARWGRIAQGFGEDPFLASILGSATVKGFQSKDLTDITSVAACAKHYVGYGAAQGGRDYNTTLIPENTLRDIYLTPFQALCNSGCLTFMSAFNDLNGVPSTGNEFTLKQILRKEWGFSGIVVSDYTAVLQLIQHGFAQNQKQAALKSFNGGLDMEMVSTCINDNYQVLLNQKKVTLEDLDAKVSNILRVKFKLNLFKNYYTDPSRQQILLDPKHKETAKKQALECPVLLQNNNKTLPVPSNIGTLAIIGALADDPVNQLGCNTGDGRSQDSITILPSLKALLPSTKINYAPGYKEATSLDRSLFTEAVAAASNSQRVIVFVGQSASLSGQANCRAYLNLPGVQEDLIRQIAKTGKPIALVIFGGRPQIIDSLLPLVDSVLYAWYLGIMAGPALAELIVGKTSPSGKLPVTFPRAVGQIPIYYNKKNTGKPNDTSGFIPWTSDYVDIDNRPLFPFGFGLSYTTFSYSNFRLSKSKISFGQTLLVSVTVKNQGTMKADEIVFLFVRDLFGSYTRPVKELKDFTRFTLSPGESATATFFVNSNMLRFWTKDQQFKAEAGKFNVWIGRDSNQGIMGTFELVSNNLEQGFELLNE